MKWTYFIRTNGIGTMANAMNPRRDDAHGVPNRSYICLANSGNAAPTRLRQTVLAARAEAATKR